MRSSEACSPALWWYPKNPAQGYGEIKVTFVQLQSREASRRTAFGGAGMWGAGVPGSIISPTQSHQEKKTQGLQPQATLPSLRLTFLLCKMDSIVLTYVA